MTWRSWARMTTPRKIFLLFTWSWLGTTCLRSGYLCHADPDQRMRDILEKSRLRLEEHLEAARLRGSREMIGGIKHIYLLVSPGQQMRNLPPLPSSEMIERLVGGHPHPLPDVIPKKRCCWNPQTRDFGCFAWCIRGHLAEVQKWPYSKAKNSNRLQASDFYEEGMGPCSGRNSQSEKRILKDFGYDFSTLPDPAVRAVSWSDIINFQKANHGRLAVSVWEVHRTEWR